MIATRVSDGITALPIGRIRAGGPNWAIRVSRKMSGIKERVQHLADSRKRTSHWIMREAIAQYVEREEKREAFRRDTLEAWEEFQETGLHASAEEVDRWLASWGSEDEEPAPECHK